MSQTRENENELTHNCNISVFHPIPSHLGSDNMYACIDEVTDRIQRKLRRFKERKIKETRGRAGVAGLSDKVGGCCGFVWPSLCRGLGTMMII